MSFKIQRIKIALFLFLGLLCAVKPVFAQDPQFSQFYAIPTYLNPAFAGSAHSFRGILHQRLQWPNLDAKFITSFVSLDGYLSKYNSGFGLSAMQDYQGSSVISSSTIGIQYAYELPLSTVYTVRGGLGADMISRTLDYSTLKFPSQFNDDSGYQGGSLDIANPRTTFADLSAGAILYSNKLWFSIGSNHMNSPNQSFIGGISKLPVKMSFSGGYKISLKGSKEMAYLEERKNVTLTPTAHYKMQGKSDQLDLGIYGIYDKAILAVWYRGIPVKQYSGRLQNNESMVVIIGYQFGSIGLTYSYDFTVSKLAPARTGGSHEFNLTYIYRKPHKVIKPMRRLPCPHFYKED